MGFKAGAYVGAAVASVVGSSVGLDPAAIGIDSVGSDVRLTVGFFGVKSEAESEEKAVGHCVPPDLSMVGIVNGSLVGFDVGGACFGAKV